MFPMRIAVLLFYFTRTFSTISTLYRPPKIKPHKAWPKLHQDPLILTPFIENGSIAEARLYSKVAPLKGNVESYAGFFTVNKTYSSNMFFWFFPSEIAPDQAPVVVWLQGGPGVSSLFGLFAENGPYQVNVGLNVSLRKYSWTKRFSMLYIDNPVGTGYSFTNHEEGYSKTEDEVGLNLFNLIYQFFQLFPTLLKNDFFVTGESYGGKYVPALAYTIHQMNKISPARINLKGVAIGNGLCDPIHQLNYGDLLYQIGLIDSNAKREFDKRRMQAITYIQKKQYDEAFKIFDTLLDNDLTPWSSLFTNLTGFTNYYNFLRSEDSPIDSIVTFVQQPFVRQLIHVGDSPFHTDRAVEIHLVNDIMRSVVPYIQTLVENYRMLIYNGQLDIIVGYPLTEEFLKSLQWSGSSEYRLAPRHIWKVRNQIAGYYKTVKNLTEVLVRNAGHMVPSDQPLFAYDLITRFVFNKNFL